MAGRFRTADTKSLYLVKDNITDILMPMPYPLNP